MKNSDNLKKNTESNKLFAGSVRKMLKIALGRQRKKRHRRTESIEANSVHFKG